MEETEFRVDDMHSNAYRVWQQMGRPEKPSPEQQARLQRAGQLEETVHNQNVAVNGGKAHIELVLPRQGVAVVRLEER